MSNVPVNVPAPSESVNVPLTGIADSALAAPRLSPAAWAPSMNVVSTKAITAVTKRRAFMGSLLLLGRRSFAWVERPAVRRVLRVPPQEAERGREESWTSRGLTRAGCQSLRKMRTWTGESEILLQKLSQKMP